MSDAKLHAGWAGLQTAELGGRCQLLLSVIHRRGHQPLQGLGTLHRLQCQDVVQAARGPRQSASGALVLDRGALKAWQKVTAPLLSLLPFIQACHLLLPAQTTIHPEDISLP